MSLVLANVNPAVGVTVNVAARIAARAEAGEVLISEEAVAHVPGPEVRFERVGPARLKGVTEALVIYRAGAAKSDSHAPGGNGRR